MHLLLSAACFHDVGEKVKGLVDAKCIGDSMFDESVSLSIDLQCVQSENGDYCADLIPDMYGILFDESYNCTNVQVL